MMAVDDIGIADDDGTLDRIFELANIARKMIAHQHIDRGRRYAADAFLVLGLVLFEKMLGQKQNVRLSLTQRRQKDRENIEAII